jgi:chromosome segregation ATPase
MQHSLQRELDESRTALSKQQREVQRLSSLADDLRKEMNEHDRAAADERARLSAELGKVQGVNQLLQQQLADANTAIENKRDELNELLLAKNHMKESLDEARSRIATLVDDLAHSVPLSKDALQEALYQAVQFGVGLRPGTDKKMSPKTIKDEAQAYAARILRSLPSADD